MPTIQLPYLFQPREYQLPLLKAFDSGIKRIIQIWHRRSGKDKVDIQIVARAMLEEVGNYYYLYPTYSQGKKALWEGRGKDGVKYLDHFPKELRDGDPNDTEMKVKYKNGSIFQVIGVEDPDKVVGTNPRGIVFSEYSLQNPKAWDLLRPILAENGGWAIFNYTPRGRNHAYKLHMQNQDNPKWFIQKLTVEDTKALSLEDIDEERRAGMSEDMVQQEFYCSYISATQGSIYWNEVDQAEKNGQFKDVPHDPRLLVHTVWDLGKNDTNCIGFYQSNGLTCRKIDYLSGNRKGLPDWIAAVRAKAQAMGYDLGKHFAPHDIQVSDYSTTGNQSRLEVAQDLGFQFEIVPNLSIQEGIEAGRRFFKQLYVDKTKCADWLEAIPQYTREYDEDLKIFKDKPLHDWTSHYADEHRYASLVHTHFTNEHYKQQLQRVGEARANKLKIE
jgi:phage terminase large subunit